MTEDVVRALRHLTLATRLRRLGERVQAVSQAHFDRAGLGVQSAHLPALAALDRLGPLTIGDLSEALGTRQPGVTRLVDKLEAAGWVVSEQRPEDRRRRLVRLSDRGRALMTRLAEEHWPVIEAGVGAVCADLSGAFLDQLGQLEDAIERGALGARLIEEERRDRSA